PPGFQVVGFFIGNNRRGCVSYFTLRWSSKKMQTDGLSRPASGALRTALVQATCSVKRAPAFVGGAKGTVMQRGRLGGIRLPRTFPNSRRWNWFRDGRPPASYSREGRERFGGARCYYCAGVRPIPLQPPRGATPAKSENKKMRAPPARVWLNGSGAAQPASLAEQTGNRAQHERDCAREHQTFVEEFDHDSPPVSFYMRLGPRSF